MNEKYKESYTLVAWMVAGCLQSLRPASGKNVGTGGSARKPRWKPLPPVPRGGFIRYGGAIFGLKIDSLAVGEKLTGSGG